APDSALWVLERAGGDPLLRRMQRAVVLHAADRWAESEAEFEWVEREADLRYSRSLRRGAAALLVNDRSLAYLPSRSEAAMIPVFRMINRLAMGDAEGAAVEARKAGALRLAQADRSSGRCGHGALAGVVAAFAFGSVGEADDAGVSLRQSARSLEACSALQRYGAALEVDSVASGGELLLVIQSGWVAHREGEALQLAFRSDDVRELESSDDEGVARVAAAISARLLGGGTGGDPWAGDRRRAGWTDALADGYLLKLAWPVLRREGVVEEIRLWVDDAPVSSLVTEDLSLGVARDLEAERAGIAARMVARGLAKYLLAREAEREAEKQGGELLGSLVGTFANVAGNATERADTRSWSLLPDRIWVTRLILPPGEHRVVVEVRGPGGPRKIEMGTVEVGAGRAAVLGRRVWSAAEGAAAETASAATSR
ncbi:MAG: hypothetical protein M3409_02245, partial [Gemmatimonadota bacterium]|nr:hypothetical protein [Gemmatimonadota bacterium]